MRKGFTMIEIVLVIATVAIIAGTTIPAYRFLQVRNDLDVAITVIAQSARRAQVLSQSVDGDTSWGIKVQSGSMVLFKGTSYASRDSFYDETFDIPVTLTPSGVSEVVYTKFTGVPQTTGTITLLSNLNDTRSITINSVGMLDY